MKDICSIAYFSMEVGIDPDIPTYSGGLGILAGDTIKSAADMDLPFYAVTLISRKGYFRQEIDGGGHQIEKPVEWDPALKLKPEKARVSVTISGRNVAIRAWRLDYRGGQGGIVPVFFLDTDLPENSPEDRTITHVLYGGDDVYRLKAEVVLGIGGLRMLDALGLHPTKYHLNEGHAALLTLELLHRTKKSLENVWDEKSVWDVQAVREQTIFTTHTPVAAGHDQFSYDLVLDVLGEYIPLYLFHKLAGKERMNNTLLAMNCSGFINGVARKHRDVSRRMFKGYPISSVTNGVHSLTWTHPALQELYDRYIPHWREDPSLLAWVDKIPDEELWKAHLLAKTRLLEHIFSTTGERMGPDVLTMGFARRATGYKRADLLLSNPGELLRIGGGSCSWSSPARRTRGTSRGGS